MPAVYATEFERQLRAAYTNQKSSAKTLGIPFLFTFEQWSEWECATKEQKQKSQLLPMPPLAAFSPERRAEVFKKAGLSRRGEKHWRARPVLTPLGTFVTVTAAAQAHGITRPRGSDLARGKRNGWCYLVDSPAPLLADD